MALDPWHTLGIEPDADEAAIKAAYRRKTRETHPDRNPDDPHAHTRFQLVKEAFEILTDPARRARYEAGEDPRVRTEAIVETGAREHIITIFYELVDRADDRQDFIALIRKNLHNMIADAAKVQNELQKQQRKLEKAKRRYRRKKGAAGDDFLLVANEVAIERIGQRIDAADIDLQKLERALELIDGYEGQSLDEGGFIGLTFAGAMPYVRIDTA